MLSAQAVQFIFILGLDIYLSALLLAVEPEFRNWDAIVLLAFATMVLDAILAGLFSLVGSL